MSNQPIEEKCPGTCTQCGGAETMWHVSETCGIGKAWANFNKKIEAGEIPDITKCPMNPMEMSNQPIEEKWNWQEEFDEKFDIGPLFEKENGIRARAIYGGKEIKSFIENLLEQERKRMSDEIEKKATFHEVAVSNVEVKTTRMVRLDDVKAIIKTR